MNQPIERLAWDSEFFGHDVFRLRVSDASELDKLDGIHSKALVYLLADRPLDTNRLGPNAELVDTKVTYHQKVELSGKEFQAAPEIKSIMGQEITPDLLQLALASGEYSRYATDPRIKRRQFERLYELWLENSLKGSIADEVIGCFSSNDQLLGFCSVRRGAQKATIGLIAVDSRARGMGLGRRMVEYTKAYTAQNGLDELTVVTQKSNRGASAFYEGTGFTVAEQVYVYHFWID